MTRNAVIGLAIVAAGACAAGGIRPPFEPLPNARTVEVAALPGPVIETIQSELLKEQGLTMQWVSTGDGYLETQWYNIESKTSSGISTGNLDRVVRFRFWADSIGASRTKVTAEAVWLTGYDPSRTVRDQESMVPEAHFGGRLVTQVFRTLQSRYES